MRGEKAREVMSTVAVQEDSLFRQVSRSSADFKAYCAGQSDNRADDRRHHRFGDAKDAPLFGAEYCPILPATIEIDYGWKSADPGQRLGRLALVRRRHGMRRMQPDKVPFGRKKAVSSSFRPGRGIATKRPSRAIEGLARKLYEAGNPNGVPWVRCGWTVRRPG